MMTPAEYQDFRARWQMVNDYEREELRRAPMEVKFQQFVMLFGLTREMGWTPQDPAETAEAARRWQQLRERLLARANP